MLDSWLELVDVVLRPSRPQLEHCIRARAEHFEARGRHREERALAIAACERRIETARAAVFSANDGVVTARMTELEREWRMLSRPDPEGSLMDLWARVAPPSWVDRKRWRDSAPATRIDAAVALAADVDGVEAAEAAADAWRAALAGWGPRIGARVRWRCAEEDAPAVGDLLAEPLRHARDAVGSTDAAPTVFSRAQALERDVEAALLARHPERPHLARDVAHAAGVDFVWRAAHFCAPLRPSPVAPLVTLWRTGYVLAAVDPTGMTLELPPV